MNTVRRLAATVLFVLLACGRAADASAAPAELDPWTYAHDNAIIEYQLEGPYLKEFERQFAQVKKEKRTREEFMRMARGLAECEKQKDVRQQFNTWRQRGSLPEDCRNFSRLYIAGRCEGPVAVCGVKRGDTTEEAAQKLEYIARSNGTPMPRQRVPTTGPLRAEADRLARAERDANRHIYAGTYATRLVAGHVPDTTWGGQANPPGGWLPMTLSLNSSIGAQAQSYPYGYMATGFVLGVWTENACVAAS